MTNQTNKSFVLHTESLESVLELSDQQAGKILKLIINYQKNGQVGKLDQISKLIITPIINQFKRDKEKYHNSIIQGKIGNLKKYHKKIYQRVIDGEISLEQGEKLAYPEKSIISTYSPPPITPDQLGSHNVYVNVNDNVNDSNNANDEKNNVSELKLDIPNFIDKKLLQDFFDFRESIATKKKPFTERAKELIIKHLAQFETKQAGFANLALENAITNSWQGVFEPKSLRSQSPPLFPTKQQQKAEQDKIIYSNLLKKYGKQDTTNF